MPKNEFAGRYIYHEELEKIITEAVQKEREAIIKMINNYIDDDAYTLNQLFRAIRARRQ